VRDMLLGNAETGDVDIATSATPEDIVGIFSNVIPVGEHFGVMIVVENGVPFEVATFRHDIGIADGRHPESVAFSDAKNDAFRRDFTINGMFFDPLKEQVLDYVGGQCDLEKKVVRAIGDPNLRFCEDYLRLLRAIRFGARFSFRIEECTWNALCARKEGIANVSAERIFQEINKMLIGANPQDAFKLLQSSGLLKIILPEVAAMAGVEQPPEFHPEGDVFEHTMLVLSQLEHPDSVLAWSALLHDIGKPPTFEVADRIRFNNHHRVGANMAKIILKRLRAPKNLIQSVYACIDNHMNFMNVRNMRQSTLKKFLSRETFPDELILHKADCLASHGGLENFTFLNDIFSQFKTDEIKPEPLITGKDLIVEGYTPGPLFGEILSAVYDLQLENAFQNKTDALLWIRKKYPNIKID